ncbi:MAG TPA: putative quinol monooxygenase [Casimicrobiaceae bacterium]|nr:putative quinol monooxygenase [Casimicrobiaceae bacterium]
MHRFALWVEFDLHPGHSAAFLEAARLDAEGSVGIEPGCRRFDILQDPALPDRVCFYEVYDDEAAFLRHRDTPHFKTYFAATEPMIAAKRVIKLQVVQRGKP